MAIFHPIAPVLYEGRPGGWESRPKGIIWKIARGSPAGRQGAADRGYGQMFPRQRGGFLPSGECRPTIYGPGARTPRPASLEQRKEPEPRRTPAESCPEGLSDRLRYSGDAFSDASAASARCATPCSRTSWPGPSH